MKQRTVSVLGLLGLIAFFTPASGQTVTAIPAYLRSEVVTALERISPDSISAVMHILASDQFEGRQPGTRGFTMASDYVQNKMKAMGLLPGAAGGSYVPVKGDSIYNGAHDNASGVAILLEIARTFRSLPTAPKRSVIITIVTGEELGLLGSDYFIKHPTVPKQDIVANLALDMPFFFHPVLDIVPYGADHSTLSGQTRAAAAYLGLGIGPDPFPEQVVFIRSDHYSFIRQGIPALFIKSGFKTIASDTVDRSRSDVDWRKTTYHTPQDDMSQAFDFNAAATHVKLNFLIGLLVCEDTDRPAWNKGDFFGGRFGGQQ